MTTSRIALAAASLLTLGILLALCIVAPRARPIHHGTSAEFWFKMTGVNLDGGTHMRVGIAVLYRGHFISTPFPCEEISESQAAADFPRVETELARRAALNNPDDYQAAAYKQWKSRDPIAQNGIPGLLECLDFQLQDQYNLNRIRGMEGAPANIVAQWKHAVARIARTADFYWATFLFELLYFSAVVWFAFFPYIRNRSIPRKLLHVALIPLLLYLPYWFGYGLNGDAHSFGGGILYRHLFLFNAFTIDSYRELRFLQSLPPFLSVISQGWPVTFADYRLSMNADYVYGPSHVALVTLLLTTPIALCHMLISAIRQYRQSRLHRRQGFPVLGDFETPPPASPPE